MDAKAKLKARAAEHEIKIRADTLAAMKDMIREDHEMVLREQRESLMPQRAHEAIMANIWANSEEQA